MDNSSLIARLQCGARGCASMYGGGLQTAQTNYLGAQGFGAQSFVGPPGGPVDDGPQAESWARMRLRVLVPRRAKAPTGWRRSKKSIRLAEGVDIVKSNPLRVHTCRRHC